MPFSSLLKNAEINSTTPFSAFLNQFGNAILSISEKFAESISQHHSQHF
jgi:hypothetical protein